MILGALVCRADVSGAEPAAAAALDWLLTASLALVPAALALTILAKLQRLCALEHAADDADDVYRQCFDKYVVGLASEAEAERLRAYAGVLRARVAAERDLTEDDLRVLAWVRDPTPPRRRAQISRLSPEQAAHLIGNPYRRALLPRL